MTERWWILVALLPVTAHAGEFGSGGHLEGSMDYRHSIKQDMGGFSFGVAVGGHVGRFGMQYRSVFWQDHLFKEAERQVVRNTNFIDVRVGLFASDSTRLWLEVGPGLGWLRAAGGPPPPGSRKMSFAVQESLALEFGSFDEDFAGGFVVRAGAQQHFQESIVPGPEVSVQIGLGMFFGPAAR